MTVSNFHCHGIMGKLVCHRFKISEEGNIENGLYRCVCVYVADIP